MSKCYRCGNRGRTLDRYGICKNCANDMASDMSGDVNVLEDEQ